MFLVYRVWEAAYEQLQMEKGVCNLIQKYSPEAVRERALSSPDAAFQILVSQCQLPIIAIALITCHAPARHGSVQLCDLKSQLSRRSLM